MTSVARNCDNCNSVYEAESRYLKRNQGKFCSRSCSAKYNAKHRKQPKQNTVCAWCDESFYRSKSSLQNSKSGLYFCSREHKDLAQRIDGLAGFQPDHYGTTATKYRDTALRLLPNECRVCGYDQYIEVLEVNHIDCNRSNNSIENLEILCPTHHTEFHYLSKTGAWRFSQ